MNLLESIQNYKKFWKKSIEEYSEGSHINLKFAKINVSTLSKCEKIIKNRLLDENGKFIFS